MLEQMRRPRTFGLPLLALVSVLVGTAVSGAVLSLSPAWGFAVIFGVSGLIVALLELGAYLKRRRRRPRDPNLLSVYLEERRKKGRRSEVGEDPVERESELIESYQGGIIQ
ncbi:MAG TPA: hypothetical protein VNB59_01765 [Solirubrobacterales bacterium]|jgi:hypothetical protein|nr:hypothetical protein [Solirubrobacterales bacterium]